MLTGKTADQLAHIARNGGGFVVEGAHYTSDDLAHVVRNMKVNSHIVIEHSNRFTDDQLAHIARNAVGSVVFN